MISKEQSLKKTKWVLSSFIGPYLHGHTTVIGLIYMVSSALILSLLSSSYPPSSIGLLVAGKIEDQVCGSLGYTMNEYQYQQV